MTYTKATFELVARIIRVELGPTATAQIVAEAFAKEFAQSNTRFDVTRFLRACGLEEKH